MASRASSRVLTDHDEIREWAEERKAHPSCVRGTGGKEDIGILRLDFPGYTGEDRLQPISWDDFFEKFDERNLSLLVQDETAGGSRSNFNKLISRETAQQSRGRSHRTTSARSSSRASSSRPSRNNRKSSGRSSRSTGNGTGRSRSSRATGSSSRVLTDDNEIREWAEERKARPSCVRGTGGREDIGMLRLDFPGYTGEDRLQPISWDDFFEKFHERNLALLVQDETAGGSRSNFNKLISRETARQARGRSRRSTNARSSRRASSSASSRSNRKSGGRRSRSTSNGAGRLRSSRTTGRSRSTARAKKSARSTSHNSRRKAA
jgi:anaerobic selenocysteine-containing dehydrogenase